MRTAMMVAALATALGSQVARADEPTPTNPPAAPAEAPPAAPSHDAAPTPPPAVPGPTVEKMQQAVHSFDRTDVQSTGWLDRYHEVGVA